MEGLRITKAKVDGEDRWYGALPIKSGDKTTTYLSEYRDSKKAVEEWAEATGRAVGAI